MFPNSSSSLSCARILIRISPGNVTGIGSTRPDSRPHPHLGRVQGRANISPVTSPFWSRVRRYYLAGILVLAPTALTLWVVWSLFVFFDNILGTQLRERGISVFGLGFVLLNILLLVLGWLAASFFGRRAFSLWDRLMHRVPLINKIY